MEETFPFRTTVRYTAIATLVILVLGYVAFQARFLIMGPQIVITTDPGYRHNERKVMLVGEAFNISRLWLNDRPIFTDAHGHFEEALVLENGYTVATLRATDRYGRETTVVRSFVYVPASFIN